MAERSFAREVEDLKLGDGDEFRGEGILPITKALLQSGVAYVGGYQGAPISHLMDVLADAQDVLDELGVHFENSASEAAAAATLAASVMYPIRGAVTFKSTVGINVASDALANLASGGVKGGALIILGEDYGEGSSIMQERWHAFAMKSQIWLLDPRPNLPTIVRMVEDGFELSEASNTPVMLEVRIRACHVHGRFVGKRQSAAEIHLARGAGKSAARYQPHRAAAGVLSAREGEDRAALARGGEVHQGAQAQRDSSAPRAPTSASSCRAACTTVMRALQQLGLADIYGDTAVPLYVPQRHLSADRRRGSRHSARTRTPILMVEEGQPDYIEQALNTILRRRDIQTKIVGKDVLPMAGEYTPRWCSRASGRFSSPTPRTCSATRRRRRTPPKCLPTRGQGARQDRAAAAAGLLHRLPGTADLRRHEARREGARPAPGRGRHRLPSVLDPAAVQHRRHHDGLRPRARLRVGLRGEGRKNARSR